MHLVEAIAYLLDRPAERAAMGAQGQQKVYRSYTWERKSTLARDLYRELVDCRE